MKLALVTFFLTATIACAAEVPITQDELVRRTQELYDALVPGNQRRGKNTSPMIVSLPMRKGGFSTNQN